MVYLVLNILFCLMRKWLVLMVIVSLFVKISSFCEFS